MCQLIEKMSKSCMLNYGRIVYYNQTAVCHLAVAIFPPHIKVDKSTINLMVRFKMTKRSLKVDNGLYNGRWIYHNQSTKK